MDRTARSAATPPSLWPSFSSTRQKCGCIHSCASEVRQLRNRGRVNTVQRADPSILPIVHLVYFSDVPRLHSWAYRALAIILLVASAVGAMVLVRRRTHIDAEGRCYVGDDLLASVSIIVVHVATEGVAAVLFLLPIFRSKFPEAKRLAKRSAISTVVSLVTSAINVSLPSRLCSHSILDSALFSACKLTSLPHQYAYLPLSGGSVRGWIYFSVAGLDIFINGVLMDYMTTTSSSSTPSHTFADTTCSAVLPVSTSLPFMDRRPSTTPRSPRVPGSEARSFEEFERRQSQAGAGPFSPFVVDLSGSLTGIPEK